MHGLRKLFAAVRYSELFVACHKFHLKVNKKRWKCFVAGLEFRRMQRDGQTKNQTAKYPSSQQWRTVPRASILHVHVENSWQVFIRCAIDPYAEKYAGRQTQIEFYQRVVVVMFCNSLQSYLSYYLDTT